VNWDAHNGKVYVNTVHPDNANDNWRFREEVSVKNSHYGSFLRYTIHPLIIFDIVTSNSDISIYTVTEIIRSSWHILKRRFSISTLVRACSRKVILSAPFVN
jgi:hypothetical protein